MFSTRQVGEGPVMRHRVVGETTGLTLNTLAAMSVANAEPDPISRPTVRAGARTSEAGASVFVGYPHAIGSEQLATRLRETASVLVAPGVCFGLDGYLRVA